MHQQYLKETLIKCSHKSESKETLSNINKSHQNKIHQDKENNFKPAIRNSHTKANRIN
jgi:hypothetical protein